MSQNRDLSDPFARSATGAACLIQFRDEWEARAEADCWLEYGYGRYRPAGCVLAYWATYLAIDQHASRVLNSIFHRAEE